MRTKLLMLLVLCLPVNLQAVGLMDNGYDDVAGLFEYCSGIKSPGVRYTYVSKLMMKKVSALPMNEYDLSPIIDKIDFLKSVYAATGFEGAKECALKIEALPKTVKENGFECAISINKDGHHTNMYVKRGEGGLNSVLMTIVAYNADGKIELAVAALIGGVFSLDEILAIMKF